MSSNQNRSGRIEISEILGKEIAREEVITRLQDDYDTYRTFQAFPKEEQEKLLAFMQGQRGLPITYDTFFHKVMAPQEHPERLESLLSALLGQEVHIAKVFPKEGVRMLDAGSFVIMDILLSLEDGSLMNVEMQKIGYAFSGERSCCYVSDMTMRQYNQLKSERGKHFQYRDMKPVFLIVLMENSSREFREVAPYYLHRMEVSYDSKAKVNSLFNIMYISLDTFRELSQNIITKLEAWLTFLSSDEPDDIVRLVMNHPEFAEYYQDILEFRRSPKELVGMFSEALRMMDRNTERYMVNELQKDVEDLKSTVAEQADTIFEQADEIARLRAELEKYKKSKV